MGKRDIVLRGSGGGSSSSGDSFREADDSLFTSQYAEIVDLIGEGQLVGWANGDALLDTYLDGTPIKNADGSMNFSDVEITPMWGALHQDPPAGFSPPGAEQVVGVEVRADRPVVREIADPRITAVRLTISVGQLSKQDGNELNGTVVKFAIDMSVAGGAWRQLALDAFNGKTTSGYARSYRITPLPAGGPWRFRVRRITPDATSSMVSDKIAWATISTLIERRFSYPLCAAVFSRIKAKEFSSIPTRQFDLKLLIVRVPQNYDPESRTYATTGPGTTGGVWDGSFKSAWTDNPAWCWYDLATNARYGLGQFIDAAAIDKFALYEIARYCDELVPDGFGGTEPRFTLNAYFRDREEAIKVLTQMAGAFRAMTFFAAGTVMLSQDIPRAPVRTFTRANVKDGKFVYVGTARTARHTVALVRWKDPSNQYRDEIEYVYLEEAIKRFGIVEIEVDGVGCTSRGQAHRFGKHTLLSEWACSEVVTFTAGMDNLGVWPGEVVATEDPGRVGVRRGGRLLSATLDELKLDAPVTLEPGRAYTVFVTMPDLTLAERGVMWASDAPLTTDTLALAIPLPALPVPYAVWTMGSDEAPNELWRVLGIKPKKGENGAREAEITALAYDPDIFAAIDNNTVLQPRPISLDRVRPGSISNLQAKTALIQYNGVTYGVRVTVSWTPGANTTRFAVRYRVAGGNWVETSTSLPSFDVDNAPNGVLDVEVTPINALGRAGTTGVLSYNVVNTTDIGEVTGLRIVGGGTEFSTPDAALEWNELDGADYYEVRIFDGETTIWSTTVSDAAFVFTLAQNRATGGPRREFSVGVRAVRPDGRSAVESAIRAINPAPPAPALHVEAGFQSVSVSVEQPYPDDVRGLAVWISESPIPEIPTDAPLYSGVGLHYSRFNLSAGNNHYLRARLSDDLGVGAISSQVVFVPMFPGGVPVVEDATAITAEPGSQPPSGEPYWAVLSQHDGKMYRWDQSAGCYTSAVTAADIEGKLAEAQMPPSVLSDLDDLANDLQQQGQQLAQDIQAAAQQAAQALLGEVDDRKAAIESVEQTIEDAAAVEAQARSTLAAQMRGGYTGDDPAQLSSGLLFNERQVRIAENEAIARDVTAMSSALRVSGYDNMLPGSDNWSGWQASGNVPAIDGTYNGLTAIKLVLPWSYRFYPLELTAGRTYTLSWNQKTDSAPGFVDVGVFMLTGSDTGGMKRATEEWTRESVTFTPTVTQTYWVRVESNNASANKPVWICGLKLKEGSVATGWTPSALDIDALDNAVAGQADAIEALKTNVNNQDGRLTAQSISLTQLAAKIGSGDLTNTIADPTFAGDLQYDWGSSRFGMTALARDAAGVPPGSPAQRVVQVWQRDTYGGRVIPCRAGDRFYVSGVVACLAAGTAPAVTIGVHFYNPNGERNEWRGVPGVTNEATAWTALSGEISAPWDGYAEFWLQIGGQPASMTPENSSWLLALPELHTVSAASALVNVARQALAEADQALAQQIGTVSADLSGVGSAVVQVQQQAQVTQDRQLASWGLTVTANGIVSGTYNYNDGTTSAFKVMADAMYVTPTNAVVDPDFEAIGTYWTPAENNAWLAQDAQADGITGARRQVVLSDATFTGVQRRHMVSKVLPLPFAAGESIRFRAIGQVWGSEQNMRVVLDLATDEQLTTIYPGGSLTWQNDESGAQSLIVTIPDGARYFRLYVTNDPNGGPFSGTMRAACISLARATGTDMVVDGSLTANKFAASVVNTISLQAQQAVIDKLSGNALSFLSANLGTITAGTLSFAGEGWGYVRSGSKWWDENPGFIIAHHAADNHFFYNFNGYREGANSWFEHRANYDPAAGQCSFRLQVIKDGAKRLVLDTDAGEFFINGRIEAVSGFFSAEVRGAYGTFGTITAGFLRNNDGSAYVNLGANGDDDVFIATAGIWRVKKNGKTNWANVVASGVYYPLNLTQANIRPVASFWDSGNGTSLEPTNNAGASRECVFYVKTDIVARDQSTDYYGGEFGARVWGYAWNGSLPTGCRQIFEVTEAQGVPAVNSGETWDSSRVYFRVRIIFEGPQPSLGITFNNIGLQIFRKA